MIPAKDGTHLATDIYYPTKDGNRISEQLPLLLQQTPYGKRIGVR